MNYTWIVWCCLVFGGIGSLTVVWYKIIEPLLDKSSMKKARASLEELFWSHGARYASKEDVFTHLAPYHEQFRLEHAFDALVDEGFIERIVIDYRNMDRRRFCSGFGDFYMLSERGRNKIILEADLSPIS